MIETNIPLSRISSTCIYTRKTMQKVPRKSNFVRKQKIIFGNRTTHIQNSTRVEKPSPRILQQRQQPSTSKPQRTFNRSQAIRNSGVNDEKCNSDDTFDIENADSKLLKLVKVIIFILLFTA